MTDEGTILPEPELLELHCGAQLAKLLSESAKLAGSRLHQSLAPWEGVIEAPEEDQPLGPRWADEVEKLPINHRQAIVEDLSQNKKGQVRGLFEADPRAPLMLMSGRWRYQRLGKKPLPAPLAQILTRLRQRHSNSGNMRRIGEEWREPLRWESAGVPCRMPDLSWNSMQWQRLPTPEDQDQLLAPIGLEGDGPPGIRDLVSNLCCWDLLSPIHHGLPWPGFDGTIEANLKLRISNACYAPLSAVFGERLPPELRGPESRWRIAVKEDGLPWRGSLLGTAPRAGEPPLGHQDSGWLDREEAMELALRAVLAGSSLLWQAEGPGGSARGCCTSSAQPRSRTASVEEASLLIGPGGGISWDHCSYNIA